MRSLVALALVMTAAALSGCEQRDFAASVTDLCLRKKSASDIQKCRNAVEALLPMTADTFKDASDPVAFRRVVVEAFSTLIEYPLELPPDNSLFGVAPHTPSLAFLQKVGQGQPLQESAFNYVMTRVREIKFSAELSPEVPLAGAEMGFDGVLIIRPPFDKTASFYPYSTMKFMRAALLLHEARHADGVYHVACGGTTNSEYLGEFRCDSDMTGPVGLEIAYKTALLYGSGSEGLLGYDAPGTIAGSICRQLTRSINRKPPELEALFQPSDCDENHIYDIDTAWVRRNHGFKD